MSSKITGPTKTGLLLLLLLQNSSLSIVIKAADKEYIKSTVVFMNELIKLIICFAYFVWKEQYKEESLMSIIRSSNSALYLVPTICYALQNFLVLVALNYIDAGLYQVLANGKIISTAIFAVLLLKKSLHRLQWMALVLLTIGSILAERSSNSSNIDAEAKSNQELGVVLMLIIISLSGFAGTYTEKMLKNSAIKVSIVSKNILLYFWGTVINGMLVIGSDGERVLTQGFFYGYTIGTWGVIMLLSLGGLIVAAVITYLDNITKVYVTCVSIFLTSFLSYFLLGVHYGIEFMLALIITSVSILLYNDQATTLPPPHTTSASTV